MDALTKFEIDEICGLRASSQDPENLVDETPLADPVAKRFEKQRLALDKTRGMSDFSWDEPVSAESQASPFKKLAKKAVRSELFTDPIDDLVYRRHFAADGELVATCQVYDLGDD